MKDKIRGLSENKRCKAKNKQCQSIKKDTSSTLKSIIEDVKYLQSCIINLDPLGLDQKTNLDNLSRSMTPKNKCKNSVSKLRTMTACQSKR